MDDDWENFVGKKYDEFDHQWCWYSFITDLWYRDVDSPPLDFEECPDQEHSLHTYL